MVTFGKTKEIILIEIFSANVTHKSMRIVLIYRIHHNFFCFFLSLFKYLQNVILVIESNWFTDSLTAAIIIKLFITFRLISIIEKFRIFLYNLNSRNNMTLFFSFMKFLYIIILMHLFYFITYHANSPLRHKQVIIAKRGLFKLLESILDIEDIRVSFKKRVNLPASVTHLNQCLFALVIRH